MSYRALRIGVSGLQSQSVGMQVTSDNLANVNTVGFKKRSINFQEAVSQQLKSASKITDQGSGGVNPITVGNGVQVAGIYTSFEQGTREDTGRTMDFMVEGDAFLVAQNAATKELLLTRNGSFQLDGQLGMVDSLGNRIMGFNVDAETGEVESIAGAIQFTETTLSAQATEHVEFNSNLDSAAVREDAKESIKAWELFSAGETFGKMSMAVVAQTGTMTEYGSGYYQDNMKFLSDQAEVTALNDINLGAGISTNLYQGFRATDRVTVRNLSNGKVFSTTVASDPTSNASVQLDDNLPSADFSIGDNIVITNVSRGSSLVGNSGTEVQNDVLRSQIAMVDSEGRLVASFYRVTGPVNEYKRATATLDNGSEISVGVGEFTSMADLRGIMERALLDDQLTYHDPATANVQVSVDEFEKITFEGNGLAKSFRLAINKDNIEMRSRFDGFILSDTDLANSQALIDKDGIVQNAAAALGLADRTISGTKAWFNTGVESFDFNNSNQGTAFGEYVGLRMGNPLDGTGKGRLRLSLVNGMGEEVTEEFTLVPRNADLSKNQFTTMGELANLIQQTLRKKEYSTVISQGALVQDSSISATFEKGRLGVYTTLGLFNQLKLEALSEGNPDETRSDKANFDFMLGQLANGIDGKEAISNRFIAANYSTQTQVYDNKGNEHFVSTYFIKDQSMGLSQVEWKFKTSLNPNINHQMTDDLSEMDAYTYTGTYNTQAYEGAQGKIAFDINTGKMIESSVGEQQNYVTAGELQFTPMETQAIAGEANITFDFSKLTSFSGKSSVYGGNLDGFPMGDLLRIQSEQNNGYINGIYSNGQVRLLAKMGMMQVENPEGLRRIGSSYFIQTINSSSTGVKTISAIAPAMSSGGVGVSRIHGGALESSNADITDELTKMIVSQRSYSASTRIITTADEMLQEALGLKR